jgi:Family of unknown function (DUF6502)
MSTRHTTRASRAAGRARRNSAPRSVGPTSLEAVRRFVRILARCGGARRDIVRAVRIACADIPTDWVSRARAAPREIDDAAHVLTIWFSEPACLDAKGDPRPLPLEGPSRSVAALVRSVNAQLDPRDVVTYLVRSGAIRRQGRLYVPRARMLLLRGARGPGYFRMLRVLTHMLGTLEHNMLSKRLGSGWFEYFAENPNFPVRRRAELAQRVKRLGQEVLSRHDAYMRRREVTRKPGEPTGRVVIGMYYWEDPGILSAPGLRHTRSGRRRKRRR